jgi:DNA-binding CsgD family transcriptional regulator
VNVVDSCQALLSARTEVDLTRALDASAAALSFRWVSGFLQSMGATPSQARPRSSFGRPPPSFEQHTNHQAFARDPVIARAISSAGLPIAWSRSDYAEAGQDDLWEEMAGHGMVRGIAVAMKLPGQRRFAFGVESDEPKEPSEDELAWRLSGFALVMAYAHVAVENVLAPSLGGQPQNNPLSPRQREVLQWTAQGKSAWDVAQILSISTNTVNQHLHAIIRTLNVANKAHAAAMATKAGWL